MADEDKDDAPSGPHYKVSEKVSMTKLLQQDAADESLQKYKASLGLTNNVYSPKDDPRRVVIIELRVICQDRPGGDIVFSNLSSEESKRAMKDKVFTLKEGCNYKIRVTFRAQHEIVSGLKYVNTVYRKGIRVHKEEEMIGSFSPQEKPHEVTFPRTTWEEAPSGLLGRGTYNAKSEYIDDDKQKHLEYEYTFAIRKGWEDKE